MAARTLSGLEKQIVACRKCDRLVAHREEIARKKRRAYLADTYWGRGVPGFGDPRAWLVLVGLAPGAHGANRTGRVFTGDRSGDFLYAALHRKGFASQPTSNSRDDGLKLTDAYITSSCRCVPPDNHPSPDELAACAPFLANELKLLKPRVLLALGGIAFEAVLDFWAGQGASLPQPRPKFGHGAEVAIPGQPHLLASYHVSQQNTQTGRLTQAMFDAVLERATVLGGR